VDDPLVTIEEVVAMGDGGGRMRMISSRSFSGQSENSLGCVVMGREGKGRRSRRVRRGSVGIIVVAATFVSSWQRRWQHWAESVPLVRRVDHVMMAHFPVFGLRWQW